MIFAPKPTRKEPASTTGTLRAGPGARVVPSPAGPTISPVQTGSKWHHPWFTRLSWQAASQTWVATVNAGLVNGLAPMVRVTKTEAIESGRDYGNNPLTGKPYFSASVFTKTAGEVATTTADIPLYFNPPIDPSWYPLGWDGAATVPTFFKDRGVNLPPAGIAAGEDFSTEPTNTADSTRPKGNRLLRAADIILHQPRQALTSTITLGPGIADGISNATQTLGLRSASPGDRLKVFSGTITDAFATAIDPLAGDYEEPNFDELLISTVYLLSPLDALPGSEPDASWQPYVKHGLFWNLNYITPAFEITIADLSNTFASLTQIASVLGGGAGGIAVNFLAAGLNDLERNALNIIASHSMAGSFYTPTGGGSTSIFPQSVSSVSSVSSGLDKAANLLAQREAAARAIRTTKLDPAFPYEARPFPTSYLV